MTDLEEVPQDTPAIDHLLDAAAFYEAKNVQWKMFAHLKDSAQRYIDLIALAREVKALQSQADSASVIDEDNVARSALVHCADAAGVRSPRIHSSTVLGDHIRQRLTDLRKLAGQSAALRERAERAEAKCDSLRAVWGLCSNLIHTAGR